MDNSAITPVTHGTVGPRDGPRSFSNDIDPPTSSSLNDAPSSQQHVDHHDHGAHLASDEDPEAGGNSAVSNSHPFAFWVIIGVLCLGTLLSSLDSTIITTALPRITDSIGGQAQYVWIASKSFRCGEIDANDH
jgi:hypothetical protein